MSRPLKVQIVERARQLIADEHHWCAATLAKTRMVFRYRLPLPAQPSDAALGAVIEATYQLTHNLDVAYQIG